MLVGKAMDPRVRQVLESVRRTQGDVRLNSEEFSQWRSGNVHVWQQSALNAEGSHVHAKTSLCTHAEKHIHTHTHTHTHSDASEVSCFREAGQSADGEVRGFQFVMARENRVRLL